MSGLWPANGLSPATKATHDALQALGRERFDRLIDAERHRGGITRDQIRDLRVLDDLTEDLVLDRDWAHDRYGLVAG